MMIDVGRVIGATTRELTTREYRGRPARLLVATRTYDTTQQDLWDALTNPERIPRWFLPVEGDLRVGGRYQFKGNAGGEIVACDSPRHLSLTWEMQGQVSWLNVDLSPFQPGGTQLLVVTYTDTGAKRPPYASGFVGASAVSTGVVVDAMFGPIGAASIP